MVRAGLVCLVVSVDAHPQVPEVSEVPCQLFASHSGPLTVWLHPAQLPDFPGREEVVEVPSSKFEVYKRKKCRVLFTQQVAGEAHGPNQSFLHCQYSELGLISGSEDKANET